MHYECVCHLCLLYFPSSFLICKQSSTIISLLPKLTLQPRYFSRTPSPESSPSSLTLILSSHRFLRCASHTQKYITSYMYFFYVISSFFPLFFLFTRRSEALRPVNTRFIVVMFLYRYTILVKSFSSQI